MLRFIVKLLILGGVILGLSHVIPGLHVPNYGDALLFAFVLALLNSVIAPILFVVSLPITILSVGLFALVINIFMFWLASLISYGVEITSVWGACFGGLLVTLASILLNLGIPGRRPPEDDENI